VRRERGSGTGATAELPTLLFETTREWERWLAGHGESAGVWMRIAKKTGALRSITYAEALDAALCHGWIDSQKKRHDGESFLQKFTPRGARSIWSKVNREKVEAFIASGAITPRGLRAVARAKENGQWEQAYDPHSRAVVPGDLAAALARHANAKAFFATLTGANRYAILFRIQTAVRPETRARRIAQFVAMLDRSETIHGPPARRRATRRP
jgi:uncharacterized protein YdeI (YjbR/CyaY-like superfamily)